MMRRDVIFLCKVMFFYYYYCYYKYMETRVLPTPRQSLGTSEFLMGSLSWSLNSMFWLSVSLAAVLKIFFCNMKTFCLFQRRRNAPIFENIFKIAQFWIKRKTRHTLLPFLHSIVISENGILYFEADQLR